MAGERLSSSRAGKWGLPGDRGWALRDEITREITNGKRIPLLMHCVPHYRSQPENDDTPHVTIVLPDGSQVSSDDADVNERLSYALKKKLTLWSRQPAANKTHYRRHGAEARVMGPLMRFAAFRRLMPHLSKLPNVDRQLREFFAREPGEAVPDVSKLPELMEFTSPVGTYFDAFPIHIVTTSSLAAMERKNPQAIWDVRRFRPNFLIETPHAVGLVESEWSGKTLRVGAVELYCEMPAVRCGMTTHSQKDLPKDSSILRSIVKDADQNLGLYASVKLPGSVSVGDEIQLKEV